MLRDAIKSIILDRMYDLGQGFISPTDLPDILADEISLLLDKSGKRLIIVQDGHEITYTPDQTEDSELLKTMLERANIGFAEVDNAIIIGKSF